MPDTIPVPTTFVADSDLLDESGLWSASHVIMGLLPHLLLGGLIADGWEVAVLGCLVDGFLLVGVVLFIPVVGVCLGFGWIEF